jgi:FtsH-binding integral membrane protein
MSADDRIPDKKAAEEAADKKTDCAHRNRFRVAAYTLVMLALLCTTAAVVWLKLPFVSQALTDAAARLLCYVFCGGGIGGCLYSMRGLQRHVIDIDNPQAENNWDPKRLWEYILHPITGAVLGVISFLFLKGGLLALSESSDSASSLEVKAAFVSVAVLAGFSSREFLLKMKDIASNVFGRTNSQ